MAESQSRYSIMEEFTEKKLNAGKRLAALQKEVEEATLKYTQQTQNSGRAKDNANNNYQQDHENWKATMALKIKIAEREYEDVIKALNQAVDDRDGTYVQTHEENVQEIELKITTLTRDHEKFLKLRKMDEKAIKAEIEEIDSAIKSLQEMSKEQAT